MSRLDDIIAGKTDLPEWKVEKYREIYASMQPRPRAVRKPCVTLSEAAAFAKYPCVYREKTIEQHTCKPCSGSRVHTICVCSLFDRLCTVRAATDAWDKRGPKRQRVLCCMGCESRKG